MKSSRCFGAGIPLVVWTCMWLSGVAFAGVLIMRDLIQQSIDRLPGGDFTNLWTAGKLALDGRASWAFDLDSFRLALVQYLGMPSLQNFSYPPHALFLDAPFALLPYYWSLALWTFLSVAFFVWCARPYLPSGFPPVLAALTPAACINIWTGHFGLLLGGLWLLFFRHCDSKPNRAGFVAGLMTFKPHMGLAIAATALWKRRVLPAAVLTTLALIAASALAFGIWTWRDFFFQTTAVQSEILSRQTEDFYSLMMPSAYVSFGRSAGGLMMQQIAIMATALMLYRFRQWDCFIAATVTFLVLPYSFNYDMTVVCLGTAMVLYSRWSELAHYERAGLLGAFVSPLITFVVPMATAPILLYALSIQLRVAAKVCGQGSFPGCVEAKA